MQKQPWTDKETFYVLISVISFFAIPWILSGGYVTPMYMLNRILGN